MNISDPYLRQIIERAIKSGNQTLEGDLNPNPQIRPGKRFNPATGQMEDIGPPRGALDTIADTNPLPGGPPAPRGPMPSLLDRMLSGVYVPPMPAKHGYEKNRGSRSFLSGLMGAVAKNHGGVGYGSGVLGAIGGRNGGAGANTAITPYQQATLDENKRWHDMTGGDRSADNDRAAKKQQEDLEFKIRNLDAIIANRAATDADRDAARADRKFYTDALIALGNRRTDVTIRGQDLTNADRDASRALRERALARRGAVAAGYAKLPPALQTKIANEKARIARKEIEDPNYDSSEDRDLLDSQVLLWSQSAGTPDDPYGGPVRPGIGQGPAPIPPAPGGSRAAAGIPVGYGQTPPPAAPPKKSGGFDLGSILHNLTAPKKKKSSETPGLTPQQKAFYESQGD